MLPHTMWTPARTMSVTTSLELDLMGLIIYVSLLLPTPKILSLPFGPQENAFLSWAHPYAAFHSRSNCWNRGVPLCSLWKASHGGHLHFRERTFSKSATTFTNNNHMWCLLWIWWHLTILRWTGVTLSTLTINIMWLLILILTWFNDYFALHL